MVQEGRADGSLSEPLEDRVIMGDRIVAAAAAAADGRGGTRDFATDKPKKATTSPMCGEFAPVDAMRK